MFVARPINFELSIEINEWSMWCLPVNLSRLPHERLPSSLVTAKYVVCQLNVWQKLLFCVQDLVISCMWSISNSPRSLWINVLFSVNGRCLYDIRVSQMLYVILVPDLKWNLSYLICRNSIVLSFNEITTRLLTTESRKNAAQSITIRNIILLFIIKPLRPRPNATSLG